MEVLEEEAMVAEVPEEEEDPEEVAEEDDKTPSNLRFILTTSKKQV